MKLAISLATLFLTVSASANTLTPVFVKTNSTGLINPAFAKTTTCSVYRNKVVVAVQNQSTGVVERKTRAIRLNPNLQGIVNSLTIASVITSPGLPDSGTVSYVGYPSPIDFPSEPFTLYASTLTQIEQLDDPQVATLISTIDHICSAL